MPLSKKRNRERMKKARLVQPKTKEVVQPNVQPSRLVITKGGLVFRVPLKE